MFSGLRTGASEYPLDHGRVKLYRQPVSNIYFFSECKYPRMQKKINCFSMSSFFVLFFGDKEHFNVAEKTADREAFKNIVE